MRKKNEKCKTSESVSVYSKIVSSIHEPDTSVGTSPSTSVGFRNEQTRCRSLKKVKSSLPKHPNQQVKIISDLVQTLTPTKQTKVLTKARPTSHTTSD